MALVLGPQYSAPRKPAAVSIVHTDDSFNASDLAVYTFSSMDLGEAASSRRIIVALAGAGNTNTAVTSITVGGMSSTLVVENFSSGVQHSGIYVADVPTSATGDVVVTYNGAASGCSVVVYAMYGASGSASDTASDATISTDTYSVNLDVPANGVAVGCVLFISSSGATASWSGIDEDVDQYADNSNPNLDYHHSTASGAFSAAQSGLSISATTSSLFADNGGLVAASFGPA